MRDLLEGMCSLRGTASQEESRHELGGVSSPAGLAGGLWVPHTLSLAARVPVSLHLPTLSQLPLSISSHCRRGVPQALLGLRSQI